MLIHNSGFAIIIDIEITITMKNQSESETQKTNNTLNKSYEPSEGVYRLCFYDFREIKSKKTKKLKLRATWSVKLPISSKFQYMVWKDYDIKDGIPQELKDDVRRIYGHDTSEFEDESGKIDYEKLLGKEADAQVVHKFTNGYTNPLVVVKFLYPVGKFKF